MKQIVILCGGIGSRLYPMTKKIPKAMLKIRNKPFLFYQLRLLENYEFKEVILCTGYLSKKIIDFVKKNKFKFKISIIEDGKKLLGTGGAIKKIVNKLDENFFVTYGDTILKINYNLMEKKFYNSKKKNMMSVKLNLYKNEKSNVKFINNNIYYKKKSSIDKKMKYLDYGCSILNRNSFEFIKNKKFDLGLLFEMLCKKREMAYYLTNNNYYEIGNPKSYEIFKNKINKIYR